MQHITRFALALLIALATCAGSAVLVGCGGSASSSSAATSEQSASTEASGDSASADAAASDSAAADDADDEEQDNCYGDDLPAKK